MLKILNGELDFPEFVDRIDSDDSGIVDDLDSVFASDSLFGGGDVFPPPYLEEGFDPRGVELPPVWFVVSLASN